METKNIQELDELLQEQPVKRGGLSLESIVLLAGIVVALATIGYALILRHSTQPTSGPAPDFTMETFDGEEFRLSDHRGSIVVLNFWASWCDPCRYEAPDLQQVHEQYQDRGVVVVGVAYHDTVTDAEAFIAEFGLTYPNGLDRRAEIAKGKYHIIGAPENFVINRDGEIVYFHLGPISEEILIGLLDDMLAEESAT